MKKIKKDKKIIAGMLSAGLIVGGMNLTTFANELGLSEEEILDVQGLVSIAVNKGTDVEKVDVAYVDPFTPRSSYGEGEGAIDVSYQVTDYIENRKSYGISDMKKKDVLPFINWLVEKDDRYAQIFDLNEVEKIFGSEEFDAMWKKAGALDEYDFALYQQDYIMEEIIMPIIEDIKEETGVDIEGNRTLEELLFTSHIIGGSTYVDFAKEVLSKYNDISEVDVEGVIDEVTNKKINYYENKDTVERVKKALINNLKRENTYLKEFYDYEKKYGPIEEKVEEEVIKEDTTVNLKDEEKVSNDVKSFFDKLIEKLFGDK